MNDINSRMLTTAVNIVFQNGERGCFGRPRIGRHREQPLLFLHHDERIVLIDDTQFRVGEFDISTSADHHDFVALMKRCIVSRLDRAID